MKRTLIALTLTLSAALVAGTAGAAAAEPSARPSVRAVTLDAAKDAVAGRIDQRLTALQKFETSLAAAKQVQPAHRDTLTKLIADQRAGLTALKTKVQGETTAAAVKDDAQSMVTGYRVFVLTGPKVRLTAAIDTELAVIAKLRAQPGADTAKLDAVEATLKGKVDALLAVKPGPDADAIKSQLQPIRTAAKTAHTDLKALRKTKK
ncbi:hypothetical protein Daura_08570 [Dactylosporangium aurantiacum]|uniref:Uncharacterized protein n=1 Tax=Dactylosporangium aurantiacum TaxID=35754 RepID=A0A9Q9MKX4_9ACTN|nr:hypothetical protein [Dactylosporangium aurantiacum]MDG6104615.1 hypothetical protein [Dactylosporangium aurantiacum]UWZ56216.1 hypothetical protein Daura_08570 [Dactylosporangium aurantiacum]